ncbi:hypothetical protein C8R45DRAFT_1218115 [Mycena sanguinolenta]|nr:hypothetical protein C8R45DRAFT_1218115 [Mycena sanguinolenta]
MSEPLQSLDSGIHTPYNSSGDATPRRMGRAMCRRKILHDNIQGVFAVDRAWSGLSQITTRVSPSPLFVVSSVVENIIRDSVTYTEHPEHKTVTALDVVYAVKRSGRTLYRFGP